MVAIVAGLTDRVAGRVCDQDGRFPQRDELWCVERSPPPWRLLGGTGDRASRPLLRAALPRMLRGLPIRAKVASEPTERDSRLPPPTKKITHRGGGARAQAKMSTSFHSAVGGGGPGGSAR